MNLHKCERTAACVMLPLLMLCGAGVNDASAQKRAARGTQAQANSRRVPPPSAVDDDDPANNYLDEGDRYAEAGDWANALKAYLQAATISPRHPDVHIYVGDAYMNLGKYKEAFAAYNEAVRVAPSNAEAYYSLGAAYNDMAMYGDAFKPFVKAISLDANYAEANYGIGYAYLKLENFKEALVYFRRALKLKNDYPEAHLSLGLTYIGLGQIEPAEEQLKMLEVMDRSLARELTKELRRASGSSAPTTRVETETQSSANTAEVVAVRPQRRKPEPGGVTPPSTVFRSPRLRTQKAGSDSAKIPQPRPEQAAPAQQLPGGPASNPAAELALWDRIKNSDDPEEFASYLKKYPAGEFADLARIRLRVLEPKKGVASGPGGEQEAAPALTKGGDAVTPAVEPAPGASTLSRRETPVEETLRLLKEEFSNKLTYTATAPGEDANVVRVTYEVVIEYEPLLFENCHIEWRDHKDTFSVALSNLDPLNIKVEPRSRPNTTFSTPIWNLTIKTVGGAPAIRDFKDGGSGSANDYNSLDLQFNNKEKAERLARLLQQAIQLCETGP